MNEVPAEFRSLSTVVLMSMAIEVEGERIYCEVAAHYKRAGLMAIELAPFPVDRGMIIRLANSTEHDELIDRAKGLQREVRSICEAIVYKEWNV